MRQSEDFFKNPAPMSSSQEGQVNRNSGQEPSEGVTSQRRGSLVSVSDLPPLAGHTGYEVNSGDVSNFEAKRGGESEGHTENPKVDWPRGHPSSAISRIGYIGEINEASRATPGEMSLAKLKCTPADLIARPHTRTAASSPLASPRDTKGSRVMSRQRIQQMHLAVPTSVGHIRPRAKPVESPREATASPLSARSRPSSISTTLQDSRQRPLSGSSTPYVLRRKGSLANMPGQSVEAEQDIGVVSESLGTTEILQENAGREPKTVKAQQLNLFDQRHSVDLLDCPEASGAPKSEGILRSANYTTGSGTKTTGAAEGGGKARPAPPARATAMQKAVAEVFAAENERRAAALASRISSRTISRAEGPAELRGFEQRSDVALAAAEQLRRMEAAAVSNGIQSLTSEPPKKSGGLESSPRDGNPQLESESHSDLNGRKVEEHIGKSSVPTLPTTPPQSGPAVALTAEHKAGNPTLLHPSRIPQHIHEAQHELTVAAEADEQRRLAAVISRARSRTVSRAEGCADRGPFADHADVAHAAAEQLRKMEQSAGKQVVGRPLHPYPDSKAIDEAAKKIQAVWRGHRLRVWVTAARAIAHFSKPGVPLYKQNAFRLSQRRGLCAVRLPHDLSAAGC